MADKEEEDIAEDEEKEQQKPVKRRKSALRKRLQMLYKDVREKISYDETRRDIGIAITFIAIILLLVNVALWNSNVIVFFICATLFLFAGLYLLTSSFIEKEEINPIQIALKVISWHNAVWGENKIKLKQYIVNLSYMPEDRTLFFIVESEYGSNYYFYVDVKIDGSFIINDFGDISYSSGILHKASERDLNISEKIFAHKHKLISKYAEYLFEKKEELKKEE